MTAGHLDEALKTSVQTDQHLKPRSIQRKFQNEFHKIFFDKFQLWKELQWHFTVDIAWLVEKSGGCDSIWCSGQATYIAK